MPKPPCVDCRRRPRAGDSKYCVNCRDLALKRLHDSKYLTEPDARRGAYRGAGAREDQAETRRGPKGDLR